MDFDLLLKTWVQMLLKLLKVQAKIINNSQNVFDTTEKSTTDAIKITSKRDIQKPA